MEHGSCTVHVQATAEQRSCMYGLRYETGSEIACVCVSVCDSVFVRRAFLYIRNGVVLTLARTRRRHGTAHGACFAHRATGDFGLSLCASRGTRRTRRLRRLQRLGLGPRWRTTVQHSAHGRFVRCVRHRTRAVHCCQHTIDYSIAIIDTIYIY